MGFRPRGKPRHGVEPPTTVLVIRHTGGSGVIDPHALALLALLQVYCVFTGEQRVAGEIPGRPFALSRRSQSAGKKKTR